MYGFKYFYKIFFFSLVLGFILFVPRNTFALTFTDCKGIEHEVDSSDTMIDYYYFTEKDSSTTGFVVGHIFENNLNKFLFYSVDCQSPVFVKYSNYNYSFASGSNFCSKYKGLYYTCDSNFSCSGPNNYNPSGFNPAYTMIYNPILYSGIGSDTILENASSYNEESILTKYNCNGSDEPEPDPTDEEVFDMFELSLNLLIQFINCLTIFISVYIVFDLLGMLLFSRRG